MTALKEYARLETLGNWRPSPTEHSQEVVVSFGQSSLVLSDTHGNPLTHWALFAVQRVSRNATGPVVFAPDSDATETLAIEDDTMVDAIAQVTAALQAARPKRRLRWVAGGAVLAGAVLAAVFWMPGAIRSYAVNVMPGATAQELGTQLIRARTDPACTSPEGRVALDLMARRLGVNGISVMQGDHSWAQAVPGRHVMITPATFETMTEPDATAGFVLMALAHADDKAALTDILEQAPLREVINILTQGRVTQDTIEFDPSALPQTTYPKVDKLLALFRKHAISSAPFARGLADTAPGDFRTALITKDPHSGGSLSTVIPDGAWAGLTAHCDESD